MKRRQFIKSFVKFSNILFVKTSSLFANINSVSLGQQAPDFFKLSVTSFVSKVNASHIKQNEIIKTEKVSIYKGWPGLRAKEIVCKNPKDSACPNQVESEAGNNKNVLAKIAGITPAILTLNGKWLAWACINFLPCCLWA